MKRLLLLCLLFLATHVSAHIAQYLPDIALVRKNIKKQSIVKIRIKELLQKENLSFEEQEELKLLRNELCRLRRKTEMNNFLYKPWNSRFDQRRFEIINNLKEDQIITGNKNESELKFKNDKEMQYFLQFDYDIQLELDID